MRKITYHIDDLAYFRKEYALSDEDFNKLFPDNDSFMAIYTLIGNGKIVDKYELTDYNGEKIPLSSLNGYQKGVILNDCYAHFTGGKYQGGANSPCGVTKIFEE